jgi:hypothetical protein
MEVFMVRLSRQSRYIDKSRSYKIFIDDIYYGDIDDGELKEINTGAGQHTIYLAIDWCRSNKLTFNKDDNEVIELQCGNSMNGLKILFVYIFISFLKSRYLFIKFKDDMS